ncbi:MAG TPA: FG-GAP-like repeat-containing protein, partial [Polyangia bacterium]|nr:FG-GAP-like repeat-containing protein [Polyangia bacterium]
MNYDLDAAGLVSELASIHYCTGATCLRDLTFTWTSHAAAWNPVAAYSLPSAIPTGHGLLGTQLIDLDGDGRTDLVYANQDTGTSPVVSLAWLNTGSGWASAPQMALPAPLARAGFPAGARFADLDGDGILDFIADSMSTGCAGGCVGPRVWLNRFADGQGWQSHPEFSTIPSTSMFAAEQPVRFNTTSFCDGATGQPANGFCEGFQHEQLLPTTLVDINGDGKMDLVRVQEGGPISIYNAANLEVLINQGLGAGPQWSRYSKAILTDVTLNFNSETGVTLPDLDRDGFSDLLREQYYAPASVVANQPNHVLLFQQMAWNERDTSGVQQFTATANRSNCTVASDGFCSGGVRLTTFGPQFADLDADGFHDEVLFGPLADGATNLASGVGVAMNDGHAPRLGYTGDAAGFVGELNALSPVSNATEGRVFVEDFAYALADINGDGLPDLIRNHHNCTTGTECQGGAVNVGGGQILYNTGSTWGSGSDAWHRSAGTTPLPGVAPSALPQAVVSAFADLNGDGLVDFIQEESCSGSKVGRGAWMNGATPPVITSFPDGRAAQNFAVSYVRLTEPTAHTAGVSCDGVNANAVYCDDGPVDSGTKKLVAPLRVVSKVTRTDASGRGSLVDTTYAYHSLRVDPNGRGPLGFRSVNVYEHASGMASDTTYAQGYPYTGLPTEVLRRQVTQGKAPLTDTQTKYCDTTAVRSDGTLNCSPPGTIYPPHTSLFVYPYNVVDVAQIKQNASGNQVIIESSYTYDTSGNGKQIVVNTRTLAPSSSSPITTSTLTVTTTNQFGALGSEEEKQGKVTDELVTASGDVYLGVSSHHTTHSYTAVNTFGGASSTARVLTKTEIEPGVGWPVQEDLAYAYDPFGNVVTTTTCANDFASCAPGVSAPSPVSADHPPFRTTFVSFNTGDFNRPAGPGLISTLNYSNGRFPVKSFTTTINTAGGGNDHTEYTAYDPIKGVLLQKTTQDGLHTCTTYDDLGRPTSETIRCGSDSPITKTTAYFAPALLAAGTPSGSKLLTVTRGASGAATWTFSDHEGKPMTTLTRNFAGGFVMTQATYTVLGKIATQTKPVLIQNFGDTPATSFQSVTLYDGFNRVSQVTEDLGEIGSFATTKQLVTTTTYDGLSLTTTRTVNGSPETRTETKNSLGKLDSVVDSLGGETDYTYDPDGNVLA